LGVLRGEQYTSYISGMSLVNIPVPADIADEVQRFAAFLIADRGQRGTAPTVSVADGIPDYPLWADQDVVALANAGTTTAANYRKIMDAVIAHDAIGTWVSIADLSDWSGEHVNTIKTFRTHLYRWINAHMPAGTAAPFTAKSGTQLRPPRGREVYYRVSAACAAQWERLQPELEDR